MEDVAAELADSSDSARERSRSRNGRHDESIKSLEELVAELDAMTGLSSVKQEVGRLISQVKVAQRRREAGSRATSRRPTCCSWVTPAPERQQPALCLKSLPTWAFWHWISSGSEPPHFGSRLSGADSDQDVEGCQSALGGVLFIDEAYALARGELAGSSDSLRLRGSRHTAEGHGGPPRRLGRHRGWVPRTDAGLFSTQTLEPFPSCLFSLVTSPTR